MAALDRRNPNLDDFVGLKWSCWVDRVNVLPSDANAQDSRKYRRNHCDTMTLSKEDMHVFGHCPAHDEIYLVVCSHCGQVVKPQAFEKHCAKRHGPLTKMCGHSFTLAPQHQPRPGCLLSKVSSSNDGQKDSRHEASAASSAALPVHQHRPAKARMEEASFPLVEKVIQENLHPSRHTVGITQCSSGPLPSGHYSSSMSPPERPLKLRPSAGQFTNSHRHLQGMRTYTRTNRNTHKKGCNLSNNCRGLDPELKKMCSQEFICNQQKAEEQKTTSAGQNVEQLLQSKDKEQLWESCHILRSRDLSERFPEEEGDGTVEVQPPYPFNQSLLLSEESEDDEQEEATDLSAATWHPKPLGLCTFGCRTLGCSIFTFDRRWHHIRFALSTMLEHHVNSHLWMSHHGTPPAAGSRVRVGVRPLKSTAALNLVSISQLETKSSQQNAHYAILSSSSTSSVTHEPGRQLNPGELPNRIGRTELELMHDETAAQKPATLSQGADDKSLKSIMDHLHDEGRTHLASLKGPVNGTLSDGTKTCPTLQHSPGFRQGSLGLQQNVVDYDQRAVAQKRKGGNKSPPLSSLSRTSKCKRISSSPAPKSSPEKERISAKITLLKGEVTS